MSEEKLPENSNMAVATIVIETDMGFASLYLSGGSSGTSSAETMSCRRVNNCSCDCDRCHCALDLHM